MTTPTTAAKPKQGLLLMLILGAIQAIMPISIDLYLPSFPTIANEFNVTAVIALVMIGFALRGAVTTVVLSCMLFSLCVCLGFIMPNIAALAFGHVHGRMGSASAIQGTIQSIIGGIAGTLVGVLSNGTLVPVAMVIGCAALIGSIILLTTTRRYPTVHS